MSTPEFKVKQKVKKLLTSYGAYHFSPQTGGYGRSGIPDIIACYDGLFIGIECKAGDNKPTKLQEQELKAIVKAEGIALVINEHNLHELEDVLGSLLQETFIENVDDVANKIIANKY